MVAYGGEWTELHTFLNVALDKRDWFNSNLTSISSEEIAIFTIVHEGG
jgi:hypothetical protein